MHTAKPLLGLDMSPVEVPMEFVASRYMGTCDVEWTACTVQWFKGAVCHRSNTRGIAPCRCCIHLIEILPRTGGEHTSHFLAHLLHFFSAEPGAPKLATRTGGRKSADISGVNSWVPTHRRRRTNVSTAHH